MRPLVDSGEMALARVSMREKGLFGLNSRVKITLIFTMSILLSEAGLRLLPAPK